MKEDTMIRALFTNAGPKREYFLVGIAAILLLLVSVGLARWSSQTRPQPSTAADQAAAAETASFAVPAQEGMRATDAHAAHLDLLRRWAIARAGFGEASAYAVQLEKLARQGRVAPVAAHLPASADAYTGYLDGLRRRGQAAQPTSAETVGANAYSARLEALFRQARDSSPEVGANMTPSDYVYHLSDLSQLGRAAFAEQAQPADAYAFSAWLDQLRRMTP
jgi:hypothetical protein